MGLFSQLAPKFALPQRGKKLPLISKTASPQSISQPDQNSNPHLFATPQPRSLDELEQQMVLESKALQSQSQSQSLAQPNSPVRALDGLRRAGRRLMGMTLTLSVPVGAVAVVNLPYSPIRRPIAQTAPFLLTPSYISLDHHFRQATASLESAKQLVDHATAPSDLELGEQKLKQAQTSLDQLPTWVWSELPNTGPSYWWYHSRFSRLGLDHARAELGRLQGKVFQEKNAQIAFTQTEQKLTTAIQQYRQAKTPVEQQVALSAWQTGIDQLRQVPPQTLAGKMARLKIESATRDFAAIGGLAAGNQSSLSLVSAAKAFGARAAQASQHPPHTVAEWEEVANLWQGGIDRLNSVSKQDLVGYAEAQKLLALYTLNQGQIRVRQKSEAKAVQEVQQAEQQIRSLIAGMPRDGQFIDRSHVASQLQQIISQLETVRNGTTVYPQAQKLLVSAQQKLKEWK